MSEGSASVPKYSKRGKQGVFLFPVGTLTGGLQILGHAQLGEAPHVNKYAVRWLGCGCTGIVQEQYIRARTRRKKQVAAKCNVCQARSNAYESRKDVIAKRALEKEQRELQKKEDSKRIDSGEAYEQAISRPWLPYIREYDWTTAR